LSASCSPGNSGSLGAAAVLGAGGVVEGGGAMVRVPVGGDVFTCAEAIGAEKITTRAISVRVGIKALLIDKANIYLIV
jgi:hypothetical protein